MSLGPSGRDDSNAIAALGIGRVEHYTLAHTEQIDPLLAVVFTTVDLLDR
jgi:hypothetical protein